MCLPVSASLTDGASLRYKALRRASELASLEDCGGAQSEEAECLAPPYCPPPVGVVGGRFHEEERTDSMVPVFLSILR